MQGHDCGLRCGQCCAGSAVRCGAVRCGDANGAVEGEAEETGSRNMEMRNSGDDGRMGEVQVEAIVHG